MQCNIDARGARYRLVWGILNLLVAVLAGGAALRWGLWWPWLIAGVCGIGGAFGIFEARKKWCVMRAMGFKTPM
jgi:hypothetical protein